MQYIDRYTHTAIIPITKPGYRPKRSAIVPHNKDVKHLPSMNAEPTAFFIIQTSVINNLPESLKTSKNEILEVILPT